MICESKSCLEHKKIILSHEGDEIVDVSTGILRHAAKKGPMHGTIIKQVGLWSKSRGLHWGSYLFEIRNTLELALVPVQAVQALLLANGACASDCECDTVPGSVADVPSKKLHRLLSCPNPSKSGSRRYCGRMCIPVVWLGGCWSVKTISSATVDVSDQTDQSPYLPRRLPAGAPTYSIGA